MNRPFRLALVSLLACLGLSLGLSLGAAASDDDTLRFLEKNAPEIHRDILALKSTQPEDYRSSLDEAAQAASEHAKLVADHETAAAAACIKMYIIDFAAIGLGDDIAASTDKAELSQLTIKLRQLIAASFVHWEEVEAARLRRLEKNLAAIKNDYQEAVKNRDKVIDSDTAELIKECQERKNRK